MKIGTKKILLYTTITALVFNTTYITLAYKKSFLKFNIKKLIFPNENIEKVKLNQPKVYIPQKFRIFTPNDLLKSDLIKPPPPKSLSEVSTNEINYPPLYIAPSKYLATLIQDEEWKPLPSPDKGVEHLIDFQSEEWETHLRIYGQQRLGFTVADSHYLKSPKSFETRARSSAVTIGFKPEQSLEIHIQGKVGKKVTIQIDSSGRQEVDTYKVEYQALKNEEFIQNIVAGNIGVSIPGSAYASGSGGGTKSAFGIKALAQKGDFKFQAIASMTRGISETKHFKGASQLIVKNIPDINFQPRQYFILNNGNPIKEGTIKVYCDDGNPNNNFATAKIYYHNSSNSTITNDCDFLYSGKDYTIDYKSGILTFSQPINTTYNIFVTYERIGTNTPYIAATNSPYNISATNANTPGEQYIFLFKSAAGKPSPYEYKSIYYIGNQNIQKTGDDFKIFIIDKDLQKIEPQPFSELDNISYTPVGASYASYYIDEIKGYIIFNRSEPFKFSGSYYNSHTDEDIYGYNPLSTYSHYYIHIEYRYETRSFNLHWDMIPKSETVFVDGRKLTRDVDYTIDYQTGLLEFKSDRVTITPDTEIDVSYEYYPFGGSLQQILAGLRVDYEPYKWFSLGTVGFYNGKQTPAKVPSPNNATDNRWVGSIFSTLNFDKDMITESINSLLNSNLDTLPFSAGISAEYAGSYYNINSFGQAMLDDFEGTLETLNLSIDQNSWYLSPASPGEEDERGYLYFKDFYDHTDDHYGNWNKFTEGYSNIVYSVKPGPYNADEGHLTTEQLSTPDADQLSLVFDYDFSGITNTAPMPWVGAIKNTAYKGGLDFRNYTELVLWVKLQDCDVSDGSVKLEFDIGEFNEDLDGDGILDKELSKDDGGFSFDSKPEKTTIGGGPKITVEGDYLQGNNRLDTEDLDGDGKPNQVTSEKLIAIPDGNYGKLDTGENELIVKQGGWRLVRIRLNKDALDAEKKEWLKVIKHIKIKATKVKGNVGKLLINEMYFSGLTWKDVKINEEAASTNNQNNFRIYPIATQDDDFYKNNSLRNFDSEGYDDLHGTLTEEEAKQLNEHTLVLEYSNFKRYNFNTTVASNTNNRYCIAYTTKNYSYNIDMRYYKKIQFWVYVPTGVLNRKGEYIFLRWGTANNYFEYRKKIDWTGWQKLTIDMRSSEFLSLQPILNVEGKYTARNPNYRVVGIPNLQNVNQVSIGIYGSETQDGATGWVWVNDLYLDDVDKKKDKAYSLSGNFNIDKNLSINANYSYRGKHFSQIGGIGTGVESKNYSIAGNWTSINWLPVTGSYSKSITKSDVNQIFVPIDQQGLTVSRSYSGTVGLNTSSMPGIIDFYPQYWPIFNLSWGISGSTNWKPLSWLAGSQDYKLSTYSSSHNIGITGNSSLIPFLDTYLNSKVNINAKYSHSYSDSGSISYKQETTPISEYYSKTNFNRSKSVSQSVGGSWHTGSINIAPQINYNYTLNKSTTNKEAIETEPWKISSRLRSLSLGFNSGMVLFITPSINYNFSYSESGFYYKNNIREFLNFDDTDKDPNLRKNAQTSQSLSLGIGSFNINKFIFKTVTPSYSKSMGLNQNDISAKTNTMTETFKKVGKEFLLKAPGAYFYIPLINEHYNSFHFVRMLKDEGYSSSISMGNSFSLSWGMEFAKWSVWSFYYSLSQNTSRNASSYSISSSWSLSGNSSLNLMDIFNFWIWRRNSQYQKSSTLSYGATYRRTNNFLQLSTQHSISIPLNFNYRWSPENSISWSLTYTRNWTVYNEYKTFYDTIDKDAEEDGYDENNRFSKLIKPSISSFPPRIDNLWNFSTSYSFKTKLPEYWKPPLFFKKPIKLGFDLNHTTTLSFMRHTYDYGNNGTEDYIHPKETLFQIGVNHSISFAVSNNIDGGSHLKLVVEETREEEGNIGDENDYTELILSWEIGLNMTIRF